MTTTREEAAIALEEAATALEPKHAWCKNTYTSYVVDGVTGETIISHCLAGALRAKTYSSDARRQAYIALNGQIGLYGPLHHQNAIERGIDYLEGNVTHWNDSQRDKRKVIRLMRRAAKALRK